MSKKILKIFKIATSTHATRGGWTFMSFLVEFEDLVLGPQRVDGTNLHELFLNLHVDLPASDNRAPFPWRWWLGLHAVDGSWWWARDTLGELRLLIYSLHRHRASRSLRSSQPGNFPPRLEWSWRLEWDLAYLLVSSRGQAYIGWFLYDFTSTTLGNWKWLVMFRPRNPFVPNQPFQPHFELHVVILFGLKINHQ